MDKLTVIKIGGNVVDDPDLLDKVLDLFAHIPHPKILVHGGGKLATQVGEKLGVKSQMVQGRRITDAASLEVVTMVYGGRINKQIVALLQAKSCLALGLTGADGNLIPAHMRQQAGVDWGFVGDFDYQDINTDLLMNLFATGITPVIAPLTHDGKGHMLNTNADTMAAGLACALATRYATTLVYAFEKKGVLRDVADSASLISSIDAKEYKKLKEDGIIAEGMIPKLDNAFAALNNGVRHIHICQATDIHQPENGTTLCL